MSMWSPRIHRPHPLAPTHHVDVQANSTDDIEAFLGGNSVEFLYARDRLVPPWAWLNLVAHATPSRLAELAQPTPVLGTRRPLDSDGWQAVAVIANALQDYGHCEPGRVGSLQHDLLVPLELALVGGLVQAANLRDLAHLALLTLHSGHCPGIAPIGRQHTDRPQQENR